MKTTVSLMLAFGSLGFLGGCQARRPVIEPIEPDDVEIEHIEVTHIQDLNGNVTRLPTELERQVKDVLLNMVPEEQRPRLGCQPSSL